MKTRLALLLLAALTLAGCANYRGLIPDKNVHMKDVLIQAGPTGATLKAGEITTTMQGTPLPTTKADRAQPDSASPDLAK